MNIDILDWPGATSDPSGLDETQEIPAYKLPPQPAKDDLSDDVVQNLIKITRDGELGFNHAAQHVHDRGLRDEFHKFARERRSMASELIHVVENAGEDAPKAQGTATAALHRTWMNVRTVLAEHDDQSILDEVERGEDAAVTAFRDALQHAEGLSRVTRATVETLAQKVERAHDRMRSLRDSGIYQYASR